MQNVKSIYDLNYQQLSDFLMSLHEPQYRLEQLWSGLYQNLWKSFDEFSTLSIPLRQKLFAAFPSSQPEDRNPPNFQTLIAIKKQGSANKDTVKTLFRLQDTNEVEAVLMRYANRHTLCISTQAGCALGCVFCATGQMGFYRNLTSGEIIEQVLYYARSLRDENQAVTNIVFMGMGEPFHNYESVMAAIERLNHPKGFNFGARRFTISTSGLIPGIRRFTQDNTQINLAISLHAADDDLRSQLMPINRKYPLGDLFTVCLEYVQKTNRRLSFEWALIAGVNDSLTQAHKLIKHLKRFIIGGSTLCHVNLILLNPTNHYSGNSSTQSTARDFQNALTSAGIPCTIRLRRGIDIQAGCGQLAIESKKERHLNQ